MTREEAMHKWVIPAIVRRWNDKKCKEIIKALEQEPCEDVAKERYEDLCEYFGGAKDILKSREDFKAWLERVKWHIRKAEELYEKYEYKKEPCDDAISRKDAVEAFQMFREYESNRSSGEWVDRIETVLNQLPPVNPQNCDKCEVGNPCLYCRHEFEPQESEVSEHFADIGKTSVINKTQDCDTCKHHDKSWDELPCDGCCGAHSGYEPQESEVEKW